MAEGIPIEVASSNIVSLVLTILGPDRPGLVERLSVVITDHAGNWVESRMAHLAGQFAGILRVELPKDNVENFGRSCDSLKREGLNCLVATQEPPGTEPLRLRILRLELVGHDRPGIVREISQALVKHGVNVEELSTGIESAPMSAEMLFLAKARLAVPDHLSIEQLRELLEPIGNDLMVDISLLP
ncbi:MAG TPA: ACT domain-containing protein [Polyangiaceae bacterium]